jgi:branched-chain amino acid transport system permease protein
MDATIASILLLDGLTNGAIYALLGLATVLVFTVTRVIFIPQGEFVAYGALTLAILQTGQVPGTVWLLLILAGVAALMEGFTRWQHQRNAASALKASLKMLLPSVLIAGVTAWAAPQQFPLAVQALLSVALVTAFGPLVAEDIPLAALQTQDDKVAVPPLVGALLKNEQDVTLFEKLVFMQSRNR